jgi:hypothetical protein
MHFTPNLICRSPREKYFPLLQMIKHNTYSGIKTMFNVTINISGNGEEMVHVILHKVSDCEDQVHYMLTFHCSAWDYLACTSQSRYISCPRKWPSSHAGPRIYCTMQTDGTRKLLFGMLKYATYKIQVLTYVRPTAHRLLQLRLLCKQINACIFTFSRTWYEEAFWLRKLSLYFYGFTRFQSSCIVSGILPMSVCTHFPLAIAWPVGRILFVCDIGELIRYGSVPGEYKYSNSKNRTPSQRHPNPKKQQFL